MKPQLIAIDFDGTCVTHDFPKVGAPIGAEAVLKRLVANGHKLILFTMRSDVEAPESDNPAIIPQPGLYLTEAIEWFKARNITLHGIQKDPAQHRWTHSPKAYANLYIDDAALGVPLTFNKAISKRPFVNWTRIEHMLEAMGYFKD